MNCITLANQGDNAVGSISPSICVSVCVQALLFQEVGSDRITEVPKLADLTYDHTLVIKSTHEYKVHGPHGSNFPCTIGPMGPHTTKNQKGGLWTLWYMESWNHMANGPCIHEYF